MTTPLRPAAPETEGRSPLLLRVAHANTGRWITVTQLRDLLGMEETSNYARRAAYLHRTGRLDRQHAADHRPDRPRFEYRFRAWPQTPALRAAPGPVPEQDLLAAVPHLSVTMARETLTYLVHETQDALMITGTTRRARATTYEAVRSGLPCVAVRPLTPDAEAVQGLLRAATDRDASLSRQALMEQTRWPWPRVEQTLSLLEAHGLLALRPVGASVLFRHAPAPTSKSSKACLPCTSPTRRTDVSAASASSSAAAER